MFAFIVRRLAAGIVLLLVLSFVTMLLFFSGPTDPARVMCGKSCSVERIDQTRKALGYDKPVVIQWADFLKGIAVGREYPADEGLRKAAPQLVVECPAPCLGYSTITNQTVNTAVFTALPVSASLALAAGVMWLIGGVGLGIVSALTKGRLIDRIIVGAAVFTYSFPTFATGLLLYQFVALKWQLVKVPVWTPITQGFSPWLQGLFLPGLTLAIFFMAAYVRLTRAYVIETGTEDYVRTARAKGLPRRQILFKHTMRAALTPLVTAAGLDLAAVVGGSVITESVFNFPGLGRLALTSANQFDLPVMVGIVLVAATFVVLANMVVDILYAFIDPRVKYA